LRKCHSVFNRGLDFCAVTYTELLNLAKDEKGGHPSKEILVSYEN
jgi:hypothetical protein